jgi:carboxymethylenebutenolidase
MPNRAKQVELKVVDGTAMQAYTVLPSGPGPFPGLIVFQEAFGVNRHIRDVADRFAREGYAVIAPELFHRTAPPGFEGDYGDFASVKPHMAGITPAGLEADARAAWDWLRGQAEVRRDAMACIGYCLGGRVSFVANSVLPFQAAISYYGGGIAPDLIERAPDLHAPMLFFWGGLDKHIRPEQVAAVVDGVGKAGKPYASVVISYADHAFFCDDRPNYHAQAARESWALTLAFLREKLAT